MADAITLRIIAPDSIVLDETVESVTIPGLDGSIGILPRHAPMVAAVAPGVLRYRREGKQQSMFISSGFAEVRQNTVRVVAEASESPDDIDLERAARAVERARERLQRGRRREGAAAVDLDITRAEYALQRAMVRMQLAQSH